MAVSATAGVMNPLLGKLTNLLGDEYTKLTGVRKQAAFLRDELSAMKALLDKMELMEKLDPSAKNWRDHVREMSYDMENCIDDFMREIEGAHEKPGFVRKMAKRLKNLGKRHKIASRIEELKVLAVEANARRERYKIDDYVDSRIVVVTVDPRISAMYKDAAGLVGIDGPREELVSLLMDSGKKLKVVSIVGFGGLGKTTLAKQVYDQIGGQFDSTAFVSVSQRPDMKSLLIGLQRKLGIGESSHAHELQEIIDRLRKYLAHKRYFILVDDLWDQQAWDIISCAFPENSNGSGVVVTTRIDEVALWACHSDRTCVYRMKHLKDQDSTRLFFNRVSGYENACPTKFEEISAQILKKCRGLPLAIITMASLLATNKAKSLKEWERITNSLGAKSTTQPTLEEMRAILNLSYIHLPVHLRPCLLYLGMYPEDYEISKDDLVRQWIAEGFVCSSPGVDLVDIANSYFNELINRSLIQPQETSTGVVNFCRVHDMMLDLILCKSTEDNFMCVAYNYEDMERLHNCEYKVRRLSLKPSVGGTSSETLATSMSQVRSYARFGESKYTPPLSQFKYLRVLMFEFPDGWDTTVDLTAIGHLFALRYLKVYAPSAELVLPTEIQGLVHLEILDLWCKSTQSFPSDIGSLANLFHLRLPADGTALPKGIQNLKSVCNLYCWGMSESSLEDIKGLSALTNLKELYADAPNGQYLTVEQADALASSIGVLGHLKSVNIRCKIESGGSDSLLDLLHAPSLSLELLSLKQWQLSRVPKWIGELRCLRRLSLLVLHLSNDEFLVLGELPSLVSANLEVLDVSQDKVVVGAGLFPVLHDIWLQSAGDVSAYVSLEAGAMPKLRYLTLYFGWKEWRGATPVGIEFLPCLQSIYVWLRDSGAESSKNRKNVCADVKSALESVLSVHPGHPLVFVGEM